MAINPRPVEPGSAPGSVEEIDFGQSGAQAAETEEVPPVPERPEPLGSAGGENLRPDLEIPHAAPRRGRFRAVYMGFFAVLAIVAVVWLAYQWGLEAGFREEVPIIKAEQAPLKVKPENPGGLVVPDQDKTVLNQGAQGEDEPQVERLLSAPESPQPLSQPEPPSPAPSPAETADAASGSEAETAAKESAGGETGEAAAPSGDGQQPASASDEAEDPVLASVPEVPAASSAPAEPAPAPQVAESAPKADTGGQAAAPESSGASVPEPSGATSSSAMSLQDLAGGGGGGGGAGGGGAATKPAATQVAAITKGDYVIQLAAVGSGDAAEKEWSRLQRSFPQLLGDMALSVQEVTVKGKLYHRVQTGPFPSRATAQDMCAQLKSQNQACIVQRR